MEKNIPDEVRKQIENFCYENSTTEEHIQTFRVLKEGAEFGYSLASKEIERLKGLIESLHTDAFGIAPHKWLEYKKRHNL